MIACESDENCENIEINDLINADDSYLLYGYNYGDEFQMANYNAENPAGVSAYINEEFCSAKLTVEIGTNHVGMFRYYWQVLEEVSQLD